MDFYGLEEMVVNASSIGNEFAAPSRLMGWASETCSDRVSLFGCDGYGSNGRIPPALGAICTYPTTQT